MVIAQSDVFLLYFRGPRFLDPRLPLQMLLRSDEGYAAPFHRALFYASIDAFDHTTKD